MELEQAQERILSLVHTLPRETIPLLGAAGRVLAETMVASRDLPPFDNSAMDGYAVRAEDLKEATAESPMHLRLIGRVAAGQVFSGEISAGQCVRVFTGSPLPAGANAVIMQEDTRLDPATPDTPWMLDGVKPWENVRFRGEDVKVGGLLVSSGERLKVGQVGLLAAMGHSQAVVGRRPIVALIATGSELREPGQDLGPGQIYENNRITLAELATRAGAQPRLFRLVEDDLEATRSALATALSQCDLAVTSGGVSVGEFDLVKSAFEQLGGELSFWKVALKPGKPFVLGTWGGKLLFGLPGNPVSAFVTFLLLVYPALLRFQGARRTHTPSIPGILAEKLVNDSDRRHFMRVTLDESGEVRLAGPQASHLLHSLAGANGLVDVPPKTVLQTGMKVQVLSWWD